MIATVTETAAESILSISIDKRSPIPVYVQISDAVRALIRGGELGPDSILPASGVVCEKFGVTRMTLRQAYSILDREGNLIRFVPTEEQIEVIVAIYVRRWRRIVIPKARQVADCFIADHGCFSIP